MVYVTWENQKLIKIEASDFSYNEDMFNYFIEITIFQNKHKDAITNFINDWGNHREKRDIVMYFKDNNNKYKYYHLVDAIPSIINNNRFGIVTYCKLKVKSMKEISRSLKISEILNN